MTKHATSDAIRQCIVLGAHYLNDKVVELVKTLLKHYGLRVEDIGGEGEFVRPENMGRFYTNTPEKDGLAPGTMVCPPCKPDMTMRSGKLYHAIK